MKDQPTKLSESEAPTGQLGEFLLIGNEEFSLRLWKEDPPAWPEDPALQKEYATRTYDTLGYVITGRAELQTDRERLDLREGDSWIVPRGVRHRYVIHESLKAIEATRPPAETVLAESPAS